MPKLGIEYIKHINVEIDFIINTIPFRMTKEDFIQDEILKRAIVRSLEIIGEATKSIPIDEKLKYPDIQWKNMAGMRDKLAHDYMDLDYGIVWDVIKNKIPILKFQIEGFLENENTK
jgi:uncharacterized protein with HEPN domain